MNTQLMKKLGARGVAAIAAVITTWVLAGVALAAPTNTALPVITGTLQVGQKLSVSNGTWNPPDPGGTTAYTYTYAWTSGGIAVGSSQSYTVQTADIGKEIAVTVSANDGTGPSPAPTVSAGVVPAPPANTVAPTILGVAQQGQVLTANTGTWTGTAPITYVYHWTSGGTPVGSSSTYTVAPTDVAKVIALTVTASNAGGGPVGPLSVPTTGPVLPLPPGILTPPTISGTPQQGQVLTVTQGIWSNLPNLVSDQWEDCSGLVCTAIPGQTGTSYTVGAGDVGHTIEVVETAFNAAAPTGVPLAASARTATVSATSATSVVVFSASTPTTNQGVTLVATVSSNSGNANPHGSLSFFNGSSGISGCANKGVSGGQTITIVCQASFAAGQAQISAAYAPDPTALVAGSTSDVTAVDIGKGSTSISVAVTPKVAPGGRATFLATLAVPLDSAGPVLPSGSIQFLDGGQPIGACASQPLNNLTASCSLRYATVGTHSITAHYDGDDNFTGSTSSAGGVQIVNGAPKAPLVRGTLGSTLGWTVHYHRHWSWVSELTAFAVPNGTTILVQCFGKGCPFAKWKLTRAAGTVNLQTHFRHRHLPVGARITVRMTRKNWVGKSYTFRIRAGHGPKVTTRCLAPGNLQRVVACPSH